MTTYNGNVLNGGTPSLTISGSDTASNITVNAGGTEIVVAGGVASFNMVDGGAEVVSSGGTVISSTVQSGGIETVSSGGTASSATALDFGELRVYAGGTTFGNVLSGMGVETVSGGTAVSTTVLTNGNQSIYAGGSASATLVDGGVEDILVGATTSATRVINNGVEQVWTGGIASNVALSSGGRGAIRGGTAISTTVGNLGAEFVYVGTTSGTVVNAGGKEYVYGGTVSNTSVGSGGIEYLSGGTAIATTVGSGGAEYVSFGGLASSTTVNSGGLLVVQSGGTVTGAHLATGAIIDFSDIAISATASASYDSSTHLLTLTVGSQTESIGLDPTEDFAGLYFNRSSDGQHGTNVTLSTTPAAAVTSIVASPATADLYAGLQVTFTLAMSVTVNVAGGTPSLTLNDGGTATYQSGSGTNSLVFTYTVAPNQNTDDLAVTAVSLNGATITDALGDLADLSGAVANPAGTLQIDTIVPAVTSLVASGLGITGGNGDLNAGHTIALTATFAETVIVTGGPPKLTLSDGGTATYQSGSGSKTLDFAYTVASGETAADLSVTGIFLGDATIKDLAGNDADPNSFVVNPTGTLQIDAVAPTVSSLVASGSGIVAGTGDLNAGHTVTLTASFSEAVTVTGAPGLTLNDGGTATYQSGSGTNTLTFAYTVASGQNTADLAVTAAALNGATILDGAGNAANLAGAIVNPTGTLQIDTSAPAAPAITAAGGADSKVTARTGDALIAGTAEPGSTVTLAYGGTPLGTISAAGGAWSYALTGANIATIGQGAGKTVTATATDAAGNASPSSTAFSFTVDTVAPTVTGLATSGSGITAGTGQLRAGQSVLLTVTFSDAVTVVGAPTLLLNDGGTATYQSGTGTNTLAFSYTVANPQHTADLAVTGTALTGATIADAAGNAADLSGVVINPAGTLRIIGQPISSDFNGNGTSDILFRDPASGNFSDFVMTNGQPAFAYIGIADPHLQAVGVGDFQGDGTSDILLRDLNSGLISMFAMTNNQPSFAYIGFADAALNVVGVGDFNGDGTTDILLRDPRSGNLSDFVMNNGQPTFAYLGIVDPHLQVVGVGDFTGDGTSDILLRDLNSGLISMFAMTDNHATFNYVGFADAALKVVGIGDFNGDGTSDILFRDPTSGNLSDFVMNNGQPTWFAIGWADPGLQVAGTGDYNGDGTSDILLRAPGNGGLSMFAMHNNAPSWAAIGSASPGLQITG